MTADQIFAAANLTAMCGWLLLVIFPRKPLARSVAAAIPIVLAAGYLGLLASHWGESSGGFSTLRDVGALFSNPWILLAGWVHYLAFDLFIGIWEVRDSTERGLSHWLVIPCLVLTFLFGPVGLLCYYALRTAGAYSRKRT